jgi:hypothetical protein
LKSVASAWDQPRNHEVHSPVDGSAPVSTVGEGSGECGILGCAYSPRSHASVRIEELGAPQGRVSDHVRAQDAGKMAFNRPVLKHGPRSLTCLRVFGWKTHARNESES